MSQASDPKAKTALPPEALEFFRKAGARGGAKRKKLPPEERRQISLKGRETFLRKQAEAGREDASK